MTVAPKPFIAYFGIDALTPAAENQEWDTLILGGEVFPGVATISGSGLKRKIDIKKPKGSDGASLKDEGYEPAKLAVELLIHRIADWDLLQALLPIINPRKKGGVRSPLSITHPVTRSLGINSIYVDSIPVFEHDKRNQWIKFRFTAIEWFPGPKPVKKGAGSKGSNKADEQKTDEAAEAIEDAVAGFVKDLTNQLDDLFVGTGAFVTGG